MPTPFLIEELAGDRTANKSSDRVRNWTRTYIVAYSVVVTQLTEVADAIINETTRLPRIREGYPGFPSVTVRNIDPSDVNDEGLIFNVTVSYSNEGTASSKENALSPLDRPWKYAFGWQPFDKIITSALNSTDSFNKLLPIANMAETEFDPPIVAKDYDLIISLTKNKSKYPTALAREHYGALNAKEITIADEVIPIRHAQIRSITAGDAQFENNVRYFTVTYSILVKSDVDNSKVKYVNNPKKDIISPFDDERLNAGFEAKEGGKDEIKTIVVDNKYLTKPGKLDDTGHFHKGLQGKEFARYIAFRHLRETDWGEFKFPEGQKG